MTEALRRTPLYFWQAKAGATFTEFAGWKLPLWYQGANAEHRAVRKAVGMFDVSHMGRFRVRGKRAREALQFLTCNDLASVPPGRAVYTMLLNEEAGVIDDLIIYVLREEDFLLVVNAANREKDWNWLADHLPSGVHLDDESDAWVLLAVQGPRAVETVRQVTGWPVGERSFTVVETCWQELAVFVARTGYTGEDGVELFLPAGLGGDLWESLSAPPHRVPPCGLASRDSLRLEAGLPLYGHELDEEHTPADAGMAWVVKPEKGNFVGREAYVRRKPHAARLHGLIASGPPPRAGTPVLRNGREIGRVTSGGYAPTLGAGIALWRTKEELRIGDTVFYEVRGRTYPAVVAPRNMRRWKRNEKSRTPAIH